MRAAKAGEAETTHGRREQIGPQLGAAVDHLAVRARQAQPSDVLAEGAHDMMVFAVHVVGYGAAHGHELGARDHR